MMGNNKNQAILVIALILLLLSSMVSFWIGKQVSYAASEQTRTYKILGHAEALLSSLKDAETGQRGYLLTHKVSFLLPYISAQSKIDEHYQQLIKSTKDPQSFKILQDIKPLIHQRLVLLDQTIEYEKSGQSSLAQAVVDSGAGNALMEKIRTKMAIFKAHEAELLEQRNNTFRNTVRYLVFGMLLSAFLGLTIVYAAFRRIQQLKQDTQRKAAFQSAMLSSADAAIISVSSNGIITSFNSGAEKLLGYAAEEVIAISSATIFHDNAEIKGFAQRFSPESNGPEANISSLPITDIYATLIENKNSDMREWTYIHKNGSAIPVMVSVSKIHHRDAGFLCIARDISGIKAQENELHISEQRYQLAHSLLNKIVDFSIDVICVIDAEGRFVQVSNASKAIWGYSPDELLNQPYLDFVHPEDRPKTREQAKDIIAGNPARTFQNRYVRKDGSACYTMWSANWSDVDQLMFAIARDMTETVQISESLQEKEILLKMAGDIAHVGGWAIEAKTNRMVWTDEVCRILDFPLGVTPKLEERLKLFTPESRDIFTQAVHKCQQAGVAFDLELDTYTVNNKLLKVRSIGEAIRDEQGNIIKVGGAVLDITQQKLIEQQLVKAKDDAQQANIAKSVFLSTMSHELRTPLNGMLGMLELLALSKLDQEQQSTIRIVRESGRGLVRIIDDVLDHSKIEAGKLDILPEPLSIKELVNRLHLSYLAVASAKNLNLKQWVDPKISPTHLADPLRLTQILGNLLSNAIKFTDRGWVEIRVELVDRIADKEQLLFNVIDTGIGIDDEAQKRLFQPFEQAGPNTTRLYGGTGLGLSISRQLAEMLDGSIRLTSKVGQGTVFSLILCIPVSDQIAFNEKIQSPPGQLSIQSDANPILAVDDHSVNLKLLTRQLQTLGFKVVAATNGKEALKEFQNGKFSAVITDCNMPEMDGYGLAQAIRSIEKLEHLPRIPIIAWTANAMADARFECVNAGMDDILIKPSELHELSKMLENWLGQQAPSEVAQAFLSPLANIHLNQVESVPSTVTAEAMEQAEILQEFIHQTIQDIQEANDAKRNKNIDGLKRIAHRIKGASLMVGATEIAVICKEIEQSLKGKRWKSVLAALNRLNDALKEIEVVFKHPPSI